MELSVGLLNIYFCAMEKLPFADFKLGFVQGNRANRVKLLPCRRKQMPCLGKFALWNALSFLDLFFTAKCFKNSGEISILKK